MVHGATLGLYAWLAKTFLMVLYQQLLTRVRYVRDSYKEIDISELPPGETVQTSWNGELIFVRRLTLTEVKETWALPASTALDKATEVSLSSAGNSEVVVCSAICTHLGCIPVPYLGAYKGWVCLCHGSVYDKFGRVRQGPAQSNLKMMNNSVHGPHVCIEEQNFPVEPSLYLMVWSSYSNSYYKWNQGTFLLLFYSLNFRPALRALKMWNPLPSSTHSPKTKVCILQKWVSLKKPSSRSNEHLKMTQFADSRCCDLRASRISVKSSKPQIAVLRRKLCFSIKRLQSLEIHWLNCLWVKSLNSLLLNLPTSLATHNFILWSRRKSEVLSHF